MLSWVTSRLHYLGEVIQSNGTRSPATCWADYFPFLNTKYRTAQGVVWSDLWVNFLVIPFFKILFLAPNFGYA
jgi:hypothetical protein